VPIHTPDFIYRGPFRSPVTTQLSYREPGDSLEILIGIGWHRYLRSLRHYRYLFFFHMTRISTPSLRIRRLGYTSDIQPVVVA